MSKLARAITAEQLGKRLDIQPMTYANFESVAITNDSPTGIRYRLGVRFEHNVIVHFGPTNNHNELDCALRSTKRAMIEDIFGEFRPMLIDLDLALWERDLSKARDILRRLNHAMFDDGMQ